MHRILTRPGRVVAIAALVLGALACLPARALPQEQVPEEDRLRIAEAFRLAGEAREQIWPGWSQAPLTLLLVTPDRELLFDYPAPVDGFQRLGTDPILDVEVLTRPRQFPTNLLAAFEAVGAVPTIVMGQPDQTRRPTTAWILTLLHEHFHQLQYLQRDYAERVATLDLAGEDSTAMWMLNYPFPYDDLDVQARFAELGQALAAALDETGTAAEAAAALDRFRESLDPRDYRYFSFQAWQEGVARYTELQVARWAAENFEPSPALQALSDFTPFQAEADRLNKGIMDGSRDPDLATRQRVAFYAVGAAMALVLDRVDPRWRDRYFTDLFTLEMP